MQKINEPILINNKLEGSAFDLNVYARKLGKVLKMIKSPLAE
jgi:hypothetical protein